MGLVMKDDGWRIPDRVWAADRAAAAGAAGASLGLSQPARARPGRDERDPAGAAHRHAVERARRRRRSVLVLVGAPALPRLGRRGPCFFELSGGKGSPSTTIRSASSGSGWRWTARSTKAPLGGEPTPAPIPPTSQKGAKRCSSPRARASRSELRRRRQPQRFKLARRRWRQHPDHATGADRGAAAGPLPRQRLRLRRGARAGRRVRLHRSPRALAARRARRSNARSAPARRWVVERTHSWLNRFRRIAHPLGETRRHLPRHAPPRLRPHHLACRPSGIGS